MKTIRIGPHEIRLHNDGSVDEIVIRNAEGECVFHLEQMDDQCFWMAAYHRENGKLAAEAHVNIITDAGELRTTLDAYTADGVAIARHGLEDA